MATSRLFFNQLLHSPALVASMSAVGGAVAQSAGRLSTVQRYQGGSALLTPGGAYTSIQERYYKVQVTSSTDGSFGGSRFQWSDTDGATWNEQNVTPQVGVPKLLSHGISITFTAGGVLPEFFPGDTWWFKVEFPHGLWAALDSSRNTEWRSGVIPAGGAISWNIDMGVPIQPNASYLMDHNFPGSFSVLWTAKNTGFDDPPSFVHAWTLRPGRMLELMTVPSAYRYWRLILTNTSGASTGYVRISELYLGFYQAFTKNFLVNFGRPQRRLAAVGQHLRYGVGPGVLWGDDLTIEYARIPPTDKAILDGLWGYTNQYWRGAQVPFAFMPLDSDPTWWSLYHWANDAEWTHGPSYRYSVPIQFEEVVRTRP
jgi:hypothetical protein